MSDLKFGLILSNRNVVLGHNTAGDMLDMAQQADANPIMESVWIGDSLFVNPRLDFLTVPYRHRRTDRTRAAGPCLHGQFRDT